MNSLCLSLRTMLYGRHINSTLAHPIAGFVVNWAMELCYGARTASIVVDICSLQLIIYILRRCGPPYHDREHESSRSLPSEDDFDLLAQVSLPGTLCTKAFAPDNGEDMSSHSLLRDPVDLKTTAHLASTISEASSSELQSASSSESLITPSGSYISCASSTTDNWDEFHKRRSLFKILTSDPVGSGSSLELPSTCAVYIPTRLPSHLPQSGTPPHQQLPPATPRLSPVRLPSDTISIQSTHNSTIAQSSITAGAPVASVQTIHATVPPGLTIRDFFASRTSTAKPDTPPPSSPWLTAPEGRGQFFVQGLIGKGSYGRVARAEAYIDYRYTNDVAVKVIPKKDITEEIEVHMCVDREKKVAARMAKEDPYGKLSKFLCRTVMVFSDVRNFYVVSKLKATDFGSIIHKPKRRWTTQDVKFWVQDLVFGVYELHTLGIVHRDLKSDNILVDEHGRLLLTDFGCSFVAPGRTLAESQESLRVGCCVEGVGAPEYWAPEVVAAHRSFEGRGEDGSVKMYGLKADMWALGLVILEIYLGQLYFLPRKQKVYTWEERVNPVSFEYLDAMVDVFVDKDAQSLLRRLLCEDPAYRYDSSEIFSDPYFADTDWSVVASRVLTGPVIPMPRQPSTDWREALMF